MFSLDLPVWSFRISFSCETSRSKALLVFFPLGKGSMLPSWREKTCSDKVQFLSTLTVDLPIEVSEFGCVFPSVGFWYFLVLPKVGVLGTGASYDISLVLSCYNCCCILGIFKKNHSMWRSTDSQEHGFNSSEKVKFKQTLTAPSTSLTSVSKNLKPAHHPALHASCTLLLIRCNHSLLSAFTLLWSLILLIIILTSTLL